MKKEITRELTLLDGQQILLNMHGFLNIINLLRGELHILRSLVDNDEAFEGCLQVVANIRSTLGDDSPAMITSHQIQEFHSFVEQEIAKETANITISESKKEDIEKSVDNIRSLFRIIHIRVRAIVSPSNKAGTWVAHHIPDLLSGMKGFLSAIIKNSKGAYNIVYDPSVKSKKDYLVRLDFRSVDGNTIHMPIVFWDCLQDLTANARKYTPPGGKIRVLLEDNGKNLNIEVADDGLGIPEDEIDRVVEFGYRATNVSHKKTMGGGFGLSKAYYVTQNMKGRMWIDSELNNGTIISIRIPRGTR